VADDLQRALEKTHSTGNAVGINALLTPREFDVYRLMVAGGSVTGIAAHLNLSAKTVSNYQTIIRQKLGAESAVDLLLKAQAADLPLT
jgi:DNA-binding NarL/FixJ family response regulator